MSTTENTAMTEIRVAGAAADRYNGPGKPQDELSPFPAPTLPAELEEPPQVSLNDDQRAVEYGLTRFRSVESERDQLLRANDRLRAHIHNIQSTLDGRDREISELLERTRAAIEERDKAVGDRAMVEAALQSIRAVMDRFLPPDTAGR